MSIYMSKRLLLGSVALLSLAAVTAPTAFAQSEDNEELTQEAILVTGTRQAYRGDFEDFEIPQAEQILGEELLQDAAALDLITALDLSASVARQNNFGGLWNAFAIRGFAGDENLPSNYLVNGFNAGRGFAGPRDISGIEAIEVLKGPKAALFGRGEPGGTINIVTKRPTFETGGDFKFTVGRFNQFRGDADLDVAVSDNIGVRLVGFFEDAESFRDTIETQRFGFYPSIAFHPTDSTQIIYELEYTEQEIPFDRGIPAIGNDITVVPIETFLGEPGNGPNETKVVGHQLEVQHDFNDNWSALVGFNFRDTSLEGFDTAASLSGSRQFLFIDGENLSRERRFREFDAQFFVVRAEVTGEFDTGGLRHRVLVGVDYDDFDNDILFERVRGAPISFQPSDDPLDPVVAESLQVINVFDPVFGQFPLPDPTPLTDQLQLQESFGVFVQDQISLTDRLDVRLGFRFDRSSQSLINELGADIPNESDSRFSPQIGVSYQANDNVALYASYGEGFRQLLGLDPTGEQLNPNITRSIEAGIKFNALGGAIQGSAALFRITQDNILSVSEAFELTSAGEALSQGFEFDVAGAITDSINFSFSYAFTDASTQNEFFDPNFGVTIPANTPLVNIPESQLSLQLTKDFNGQGFPLRIGGGLLFVSERSGQFGDFFGQGEFNLPSYVTLRSFAEYDVTDNIRLRLDVDNITDEEFFLNSFASLWVQPGAPRTWRVSVGYAF